VTTVENSGAECDVPELVAWPDLDALATLPDPFTKLDGTRITAKSEWACRRQEIYKQAEAYIYGEKPARPDLVTGVIIGNKISVRVEEGGSFIEFEAEFVSPSGPGAHPVILHMGSSATLAFDESFFLGQGVGIIYYDYLALGEEHIPGDTSARSAPKTGLFYQLYGGAHSAGLLMAWAWGASRLIDVIQDSGGGIIDLSGLGVTGCSAAGRAALLAGAFDERITLTIPQESGTGGVPVFRLMDILDPLRTINNYYEANWLGSAFAPFANNSAIGTTHAVDLPIDTHELVAMVAPRGLLVLDNPHEEQTSAEASHLAALGGLEVYRALGAEMNLSYHSDVTDTGHCTFKPETTELLLQNIQKFLKHENDDPSRFEVGPGSDADLEEWRDWQTPTLSD
jgi:hypothetical protein